MNFYYVLAVGTGGFLGAIARYYTSQKLNKAEVDHLPLGTLAVNLIGSFLLGFILSIGLKDIYILLIGTGFLGAFTTFSTLHKEASHPSKISTKVGIVLSVYLRRRASICISWLFFRNLKSTL